MALVEGCKHEIEITVPPAEVGEETERVVDKIRKQVKLPGFRPGKAPASLVRVKFAQEIRKDVIESLVPKFFRKKVDEDGLKLVGEPAVSDVRFHSGEPFRFKVEFEVAPDIELGEYRGVAVEYREPEVAAEDVEERLAGMRDQKAEYVNIDPRPLEDGDHAAVSLRSVEGVEPPIQQDELVFHVGGEGTLPEFTANLRGAAPGEERVFSVTYPEDYAQQRLSGKTVRFAAAIKAVRRKELPEANDEFAHDVGDYQTLDELKETIRLTIFKERELRAQQEAKARIVAQLVEAHAFAIPETFIERQIENQVENQLRAYAAQGVDPRGIQLDWARIRKDQREPATRDVKASLLVEKIAERESIEVMQDEVDREVQRIARQRREPVAAVRQALEKDGTVRRIAGHIRTEKTLNFLFEHARKEVPAE